MPRAAVGPWSWVTAFLALLGGLTLAAALVVLQRPPRPLPEDAPATDFAAGRAMRHVEALARAPRPLGSAGHEAARRYILDELAALGIPGEVAAATSVVEQHGVVVAARVANVVARLRGRGAGRALLLAAHYDTRSHAPGAGDDACGVATLLETLRALRSGTPLGNDVIALFTDGEELGLLGAEAFAAEHPWAADVALVLNFEGRGSRGVVPMFETTPGNGRLVAALRRVAPYPLASSLSYEVYRRMPNDTDLTVFRRAGVAGLNFAFIEGLEAYHSALDVPQRLDPASLQHQGSYALALARGFGDEDLDGLAAPDAVYFNPFGWRLLVYPASWAAPLGGAAVLLWGLALALGRRRAALRWRGVGAGLAAFAVAPLLAAVLAYGGWWALGRAFPELLQGPSRLPYDSPALAWSLWLLALAAAVWVYPRAARRDGAGPFELASGVAGAWSALALAVGLAVPGASFLFTWPALAMSLALALAFALGARLRRGPAGLVALAAGALPGILLLAPAGHLMGVALTLAAAPVVVLPAALMLGLFAAQITVVVRRPGRLALGLLLLALATAAAVGWHFRADALQPRADSLFYALDADSGAAWWVSDDAAPDAWTGPVLGERVERGTRPEILQSAAGRGALLAAAAPAALPAPEVRLAGDGVEAGRRTLTVAVRSARGAPILRLAARCLVEIEALRIDGRRIELSPPASEVRMVYHGVPAEGVELGFEMLDRQPVQLSVLDQSYGLPELPGSPPAPRPAWIIPDTGWWTDSTLVHKSFWY